MARGLLLKEWLRMKTFISNRTIEQPGAWSKGLKERGKMYSRSNRESSFVKVKPATIVADIDDVEIMEKAIALVNENSPEHRDLIGRLVAAARSLPGRQPIPWGDEGCMTYRDRPQSIAKTVLGDLRYNR